MELDKEIVERIKSVCMDVAENVGEIANTRKAYIPDYALYEEWRHNGEFEGDRCSTNLRMDWEFSDAAHSTPEGIVQSMVLAMNLDMLDLILNGDRNSEDAFLKALDGAKVRGKQPVDFQCIHAMLYTEKKEREGFKTTEYTLYLRPLVVWK